jgi:hypothetical protein
MTRWIILASLALAGCGSKSHGPADPPGKPPAKVQCVKSGCSGTVCVEEGKEIVTTCEYKAEYACYSSAACETQPDGKCGWTQTPELKACLANPPAAAGGSAGPQ